eukprot:c23325_g1_i1.p1 GENE.c23325_g1_i1~~c23325_g1_i1.p1  ORF type:complete len:644 (-),score=135.51 c23325_g1_i1:100-2031(-)
MNVFSRPMAAFVGRHIVLPVLKDFQHDKFFCFILSTSLLGIGIVSVSNAAGKYSQPAKSSVSESSSQQGHKKKGGPAVDAIFLKRLKHILAIAIPGFFSREALLLIVQAIILIARSLLSLRIAKLSGDGLREVMRKSWIGFARCMFDFFMSGVAASVVNSALKYLTNLITVRFRLNLSHYVHDHYLANRNYYKAAVLRQGNLDNADQRIVEDLHQFCITVSDLYSRTFKPAVDVVLSTYRMSENMGFKGLTVLYSYFLLSGSIVRSLSPPFPRLIAHQQVLEGNFRRSHNRIITHAEEIAFLEGSEREKIIVNTGIQDVSSFGLYYFYLHFKQGILDQWFLKYGASMIGWPVLALPFLMHKGDMAETAARYRESDSLIQAASSSIGDLMMVYKKLQRLSGFTARVMELLEAVDVHDLTSSAHLVPGRDRIEFRNVTVHTPDGRLLVNCLNLELQVGCNVFVSGANGAGKSSMFRVLAGLWAPRAGTVLVPPQTHMFYVPQRPYMVTGSLRDQVTYPLKLDSSVDKHVMECLEYVGLTKLVRHSGEQGLDAIQHDWADVLSGGEKQRLGLARLYFHRPTFAILDEATSAINANEEGPLYEVLGKLHITVFSISHRPSLLPYHHKHLHFIGDGTGAWELKDVASV